MGRPTRERVALYHEAEGLDTPQVRRVRSWPQRAQRASVTSLPRLTSKRRSPTTFHLWKPCRHSVLPSALALRSGLGNLMTLVMETAPGWNGRLRLHYD